ncbi:hypothetical protein RND71_002048 [Anisodus tanguticus]|uniref:Cytochrome P450 76AD1-like protein n=1 Tax=Anisodus tanguticus TaxID=243964 RepID=A0AAE1VWA0_9SOLA|nr:hypothetical protein RND71_002048 [Anisodus tanguticus]
MLQDLFAAGTDTTTSTLEWAMAEILKQPVIMTKAKVELAEFIGKGKSVEEIDVSQLPYLQCIVKETLRMHPPFLGGQSIFSIDGLEKRTSITMISLALPLVLRMVPVMLGSLLNCFNWKLEAGIRPKDLDTEEKIGITLAKNHPLQAIPSSI